MSVILVRLTLKHAFLSIPTFFKAFLLCIRTVENSEPSLLADIDPKLSVSGLQTLIYPQHETSKEKMSISSTTDVNSNLQSVTKRIQNKAHRRIHSDPIYKLNERKSILRPSSSIIDESNERCHSAARLSNEKNDYTNSHSSNNHIHSVNNQSNSASSFPAVFYQPQDIDSYSSSFDSITTTETDHSSIINTNFGGVDHYQTLPDTSLRSKKPVTTIDTNNNRGSISSQTTLTVNINNDNNIYDSTSDINQSIINSPILSSSPVENSISVSSSYNNSDVFSRTDLQCNYNPYFPNSCLRWPKKGQTLDSYIRENDSKTRTDVEKENAHFYFSEALIAAIEQIKFTKECKRRFQIDSTNPSLLIGTLSYNESSTSSTESSSPYIPCNLNLIQQSQKKAALYNETPAIKQLLNSEQSSGEPPQEFDWSNSTNLDETSAEAIALALMDTYKQYRMPTAPELFWMIKPDEDFPQDLLPLPDYISVDPSEDYIIAGGHRVQIRGNLQWAPPREQLIFNIHPPP
ncbi:unnamed protein product, partial [Didymodactylos carnosus]